MKQNVIQEKSYLFALKIIRLYKELVKNKEFVLSKQLLKAGTSIGANVEEAIGGQSRADFLSRIVIATKEARECLYWLRLLRDSDLIDKDILIPYLAESEEIVKLLSSIVKTTKGKK